MYNILTKKLECNNIPFHSHYLVPARAAIFGHLKRIIPQTMTDNRVWRSSVFDTQLSYAEYFTNNLLNSVFLEKVTQSIPENAIMLEIAPDGILQDVMREFSDINIALLQRNHKDNVKVLLQGLGKMYNNGLQPQLANLYPSVQFPVSRGTPMISPSIKYI
jgi:fatty acid synthase